MFVCLFVVCFVLFILFRTFFFSCFIHFLSFFSNIFNDWGHEWDFFIKPWSRLLYGRHIGSYISQFQDKSGLFFFKSINFQLFNFFSTVIISTAVIVKNCFLIKHLSQFEWYWIGSSCTCRVDVAGRLPSINFNENSHIETQWQNSKF